jgi:hypothetical protein
MGAAQQSISQFMFSEVCLDVDLWEEHLENTRDIIQRRRLKKQVIPRAFEWQYGGTTYSVAPGETVTVPYEAADHGVRASRIFQREKNPETGEESLKTDKDSEMMPMLDVVRTFNATDPSMAPAPVPESRLQKCPWCRKDVRDLKAHTEKVHFPQGDNEPQVSVPDKISADRDRKDHKE